MTAASRGTIRAVKFLIVLAVGGTLLATVTAADAKDNKKKNHKPNPQQQAAAAKKSAAAHEAKAATAARTAAVAGQEARAAAMKGNEAISAARQAATDAKYAENDAKSAAQQQKNIEAKLEDAQKPDSEFGKIKADYLRKVEALKREETRVLNSPDYKAKCQSAKAANETERLGEIRQEALDNDTAYRRARLEYDAAKRAYDDARRKLYTSSDEWKTAVDQSREARDQQQDAEGDLKGALLHKAGAGQVYRGAARTAAAAQGVANQEAARAKELEKKASNISHNKNNHKKKR